jgi:hypothetical protein
VNPSKEKATKNGVFGTELNLNSRGNPDTGEMIHHAQGELVKP